MGMYTAATYQMNQAMEFGFLAFIPDAFLYVALLAWAVTFFGLLHSVTRRARPYLRRIP